MTYLDMQSIAMAKADAAAAPWLAAGPQDAYRQRALQEHARVYYQEIDRLMAEALRTT